MGNRKIRKLALGDQHGIFQHFQSEITDYPSRERYISMRGGQATPREERLYGITSEKEASYVPTEHVAPHLSTRYSPDRIGVQAMRVPGSNGGVFQDPYTKKIYDYNEGFSTESGRSFPPGNASMQTSLMTFAKNLESSGLTKESAFLNNIIKNNSNSSAGIDSKSDSIIGNMIKIANMLDEEGLHTEANKLDQILAKRAGRLRNWADRLGFNTGQWAMNEAADMEAEEIAAIAMSLPPEKQMEVVDMLFDNPAFREMAVSTLDAAEVAAMAKSLPPSVKSEVVQMMVREDPQIVSSGLQGLFGDLFNANPGATPPYSGGSQGSLEDMFGSAVGVTGEASQAILDALGQD